MKYVAMSALGIVLSSGCAQAVPELALDQGEAVGHELVHASSPILGPAYTASAPSLGVSGSVPDAPVGATGPGSPHGVRFSDGKDLNGPKASSREAWRAESTSLAHAAAPTFGSRLDEALTRADVQNSKLDDGGIASVLSFLAKLGGGAPETTYSTFFEGSRPVRARWLKSQWVPASAGSGGFDVLYRYADPVALADTRERGARLYCAAREAQFRQGGVGSTLGELAPVEFELAGQTIKLLVVEPTFVLDGPERYTARGANDGAQAFAVPMLVGNRVTPIHGIGLPGLPEVRSPATLVSGDSEILITSDRRIIRKDGGSSGPFGGRKTLYVDTQTRAHQTVTHVDAIQTAAKGVSAGASFTLFYVGPVAIQAGLTFRYFAGATSVGGHGSSFDTSAVGYPSPREGAAWWNPSDAVGYHHGPWRRGQRASTVASKAFWYAKPDGFSDPRWAIADLGAMNTRVEQSDDRGYLVGSGMGLGLSLSGVLGGSVGPFSATLSVTGAIDGTVTQSHAVRELMLPERHAEGSPLRPVTQLVVRPRTVAAATAEAHGDLHLELDLGWFGTIERNVRLFSTPRLTLASYDSDTTGAWGEQNTVRIGTGSASGDPMLKPSVKSHFAGKRSFDTFALDVPTCLGDPRDNPPPPPRCDANPTDPGKPPVLHLCAWGPRPQFGAAVSGGICADVSGYVSKLLTPSAAPAKTACMQRYLGYLCTGTHKEQLGPEGRMIVAKRLSSSLTPYGLPTDPTGADALEYQSILEECAVAYVGVHPGKATAEDTARARAWLEGFTGVSFCSTDATLIAPDRLISKSGDASTPPKAGDPKPCR